MGLLARWAVTPEKLGGSRFLKQLPSVCRQDPGDPGFSDVTREGALSGRREQGSLGSKKLRERRDKIPLTPTGPEVP